MNSQKIALMLVSTALLYLADAARVTNPSKVPRNAVLLSQISSLTLRAGKQTSSRRMPAIPQLQCVGPASICRLYDVDVIRCKNDGADYDQDNVQWTCTASLPDEFKLGATDVSCEGYESNQDPYVLKGSCAVAYRLALTAAGEQKFGLTNEEDSWTDTAWARKSKVEKLLTTCFWFIFVGVLAAMILSACGCLGGRVNNRPGWGGPGGGDGGPGDPYDRGPPPPYSDSYRPPKSYGQRGTSSWFGSDTTPGLGAWRPGFWTGAGAGAAASYLLNNRRQTDPSTRYGQNEGAAGGNSWFGSARRGAGASNLRSSSGTSSYSSSRYESTGFGSTTRR